MFCLQVFLSHSMAEEDVVLNQKVRKAIENQHCEIHVGSELKSGSLSKQIKAMIAQCHVAVCVVTARQEYKLPDGCFALPPWIQQEITHADACQLQIILAVESGVRANDFKILGDVGCCVFDRSDISDLLLDVTSALSTIQGPPAYKGPVLTMFTGGKYIERWGPVVGQLLEAAASLISVKHHSDARELLRKALIENEHCWTAHLNLGMSFLETGQPEEAKPYFEKVAYECDEKMTRAKGIHNLGVVYELTDGNHDKNLVRKRQKLFSEAVHLVPHRINSLYSIFLCHLALEEYAEADKVFRDSLKLDGFVDHVRQFLNRESSEVVQALAKCLDPLVMDITFPQRNIKGDVL